MVKKSLIAFVLFYLLGVFGVGGGYLSQNWSDGWAVSDQVLDALVVGILWPIYLFDLFMGS